MFENMDMDNAVHAHRKRVTKKEGLRFDGLLFILRAGLVLRRNSPERSGSSASFYEKYYRWSILILDALDFNGVKCRRYSILLDFVFDTDNMSANSFGINQQSLWLITVFISYETINYQGGSKVANPMQIPPTKVAIGGQL